MTTNTKIIYSCMLSDSLNFMTAERRFQIAFDTLEAVTALVTADYLIKIKDSLDDDSGITTT